jgi:hypothetical protein
MRLFIAGLLACAGLAFAADKAPVSYHDGTLVSFHMAASGDKCTEGRGEKDCVGTLPEVVFLNLPPWLPEPIPE